MNSFPYRNIVDLVELKGEDLAQVFEQVASLYDKEKPDISFLQVSGIFILCFKYHTKILKEKETTMTETTKQCQGMEKLLKNDDLYLKTHIPFYTVYR